MLVQFAEKFLKTRIMQRILYNDYTVVRCLLFVLSESCQKID